jgi:hypothetical protein
VAVPARPKIYHIAHVDRLAPIVADGGLWCDAEVVQRAPLGTTIGMNNIKQRRLSQLRLTSHPQLRVGDCVPFYFCPRSIMLFIIHKANHPDLSYRGGQDPIVHLEADLHAAVAWANGKARRWAFSLSNAGSRIFEDRSEIAALSEIDWDAVRATDWRTCQEGKQAEFLVEYSFPWALVERIGVHTRAVHNQAVHALPVNGHRPPVEVRADWYY